MYNQNYLLQEAVEKGFDSKPYVAEMKKILNTCQLTKFKSQGECAKFYSAFFMNAKEGDPLTFKQWCEIYTVLLGDDKFCSTLCLYIAMFQPADYSGMFSSLQAALDAELEHMRANRIRFLSDAKAFFRMMLTRMDSIGETVKVQVLDPAVIKFITTINGVLNSQIFYVDKLIQNEMSDETNPDDIVKVVRTPITEGALAPDIQEIIDLLEHAEGWYAAHMAADPLNEGIVNNAQEKAKELAIKAKKTEKAFDEFVMKKVKKAREERRNRKHAEMVGEALRINHELKRLLGSAAIGYIISPAWGVITWVISVVIDRQTDKKDRDILVGQLKDELEIIEEKISQADRKDDAKAKVELIRLRQKLSREYERINKVRFDPSRIDYKR